MSNGPGEPPSTPANPPPSSPPTLPVSEGGLDSDDRMVIRVVEEFTETVEEANREQARIVIVTAIVALVSAIAGPLVALKINSDQIGSQRDTSREQAATLRQTTDTQNQQEAARNEDEFIRTERRVAYTDFLATYNNGAVDLTEIGGKLTAATYPPRLIAKDLQSLIDILKGEQRDYYTVTLLASADSRDKARSADREYTGFCVALIQFARSRLQGTRFSATEFRQQNKVFVATYNRLISLSAEFIDSARVDVSANKTDASTS
ncbi:hypothetical protein [Nocardioides sp.]|uniref:hypothetical protein n=1 Tax=Nocardioides sp. TaxID=35761 RepID=UPI0031FE8350|nr:hypothetical protein [Nocardioides sp.]